MARKADQPQDPEREGITYPTPDTSGDDPNQPAQAQQQATGDAEQGNG